jgi:hypothetical protein
MRWVSSIFTFAVPPAKLTFMRANSFSDLKKAEARERMADYKRARTSRRLAAKINQRNGLVNGAKGTITNLKAVMQAMARWA